MQRYDFFNLVIYGFAKRSFQKRKRQSEAKPLLNGSVQKRVSAADTSKPTAVFQPIKGRDWTVSVALPGSIIAK